LPTHHIRWKVNGKHISKQNEIQETHRIEYETVSLYSDSQGSSYNNVYKRIRGVNVAIF